MSRRGRTSAGPGDDVAVNRPTPMPAAVRPPRHDRAIEINGTWQELVRLTRRAIVPLVLAAILLALVVTMPIVATDVGGVVFLEFWLVGGLLLALRRPVAAARAWWIVTHHPWCDYRARVGGSENALYVDLASAAGSKKEWSSPVMSLRPRVGKRQREELTSGAFANVWFVGGDTSKNGLIVPSGGGTVVFVRRRAAPGPSRRRATARPSKPLSARAIAARERSNARVAARVQKAQDRRRAADVKAREKAARMTPEQRARVARKAAEAAARDQARRAAAAQAVAKRSAAAKAAAAAPRRPARLGRRGQSLGRFLPKD